MSTIARDIEVAEWQDSDRHIVVVIDTLPPASVCVTFGDPSRDLQRLDRGAGQKSRGLLERGAPVGR